MALFRTCAGWSLTALLSLSALLPGRLGAAPLFSADAPVFSNYDKVFYRLPSVIVSGRGTVLVATQKRLGSGGDWALSSLVLRRSADGGKSFEAEQTLYEGSGDCVFNGNVVEDRTTGTIFAFFIAFPQVQQGDWFTHTWLPQGGGFSYVKSTDDGNTWSQRIDVMPAPNADGWHGGGAFNNNHGIQLREGPHAGRLIIGARVFKPGTMEVRSKGGLIYSDDHGATWKVGGVMLQAVGTINGEVVVGEAPGGEVYVNSRNEAGRAAKPGVETSAPGVVPHQRIYSRSRDGGETFYAEGCHPELFDGPCNAGETEVPADQPGAKAVMLFTAPAVRQRTKLTAYLSRDGGHTWTKSGVISEKAGGYSDDAALKDGTILTVYENGRGEAGPAGLLIARYNLSGLTSAGSEKRPDAGSPAR